MDSDYEVFNEEISLIESDEQSDNEQDTIIEINPNMYENVIIGKKIIQITNKLKFTYYELRKWSVSKEDIALHFNSFIVVMKIPKNDILDVIKKLSVNIVSELLESKSISSFEEGLNIYNQISIYDNFDSDDEDEF